MTLKNVSFQSELRFSEDHVYSMEVRSPRMFGRFAQSMLALQNGEIPMEPFSFFEDDTLLSGTKLLYVITDPMQIDLNNKKNLSVLYSKLDSMIVSDMERYSEWQRLMISASEIVEDAYRQMPFSLYPGFPNTTLCL